MSCETGFEILYPSGHGGRNTRDPLNDTLHHSASPRTSHFALPTSRTAQTFSLFSFLLFPFMNKSKLPHVVLQREFVQSGVITLGKDVVQRESHLHSLLHSKERMVPQECIHILVILWRDDAPEGGYPSLVTP